MDEEIQVNPASLTRAHGTESRILPRRLPCGSILVEIAACGTTGKKDKRFPSKYLTVTQREGGGGKRITITLGRSAPSFSDDLLARG